MKFKCVTEMVNTILSIEYRVNMNHNSFTRKHKIILLHYKLWGKLQCILTKLISISWEQYSRFSEDCGVHRICHSFAERKDKKRLPWCCIDLFSCDMRYLKLSNILQCQQLCWPYTGLHERIHTLTAIVRVVEKQLSLRFVLFKCFFKYLISLYEQNWNFLTISRYCLCRDA